jgi:hypothetical protein
MPIIKERLVLYASQQIVPTLRGMFYTLVFLNILQNTSVRYDYLSRFTARARENGDLPIDCFADNVRQVIEIDDDYETVEEYLQRGINHINYAAINYEIPRWLNQPHYVEVWYRGYVSKGSKPGKPRR